MTTIAEALQSFLDETGRSNPGSMASPASIIDLFSRYLNDYAYEDLNEFEQPRFEEEYDQGRRFCEMFDAGHIRPHHLNFFLSYFVIRKVMGTKGFLKACGPTMRKLAKWLREKDHWSAEDLAELRELAGEKPGADLGDCDEFGEALHKYVENHWVDAPDDLPDEDYYDDQFTIKNVEPSKLHLDALMEGEDEIILSLPKTVTSKAREGWSVNLELARLRGKWKILGVGSVYP